MGALLNRRITALFKLKRIFTLRWNLIFPPIPLRPYDIRIEDERSDLREVLGFEAEAIYIPGHSSDSQALLLTNVSALCGDMAPHFLKFAGLTSPEQSTAHCFAPCLMKISNGWTAPGKVFWISVSPASFRPTVKIFPRYDSNSVCMHTIQGRSFH